jgi:hypothetical protein
MPERRLISSGSPFEKSFGYSRAVVDGDYVFVSGTTGYDYATMIMPEDAADQARNIARTFAAALAEAGAGLADGLLRAGASRPRRGFRGHPPGRRHLCRQRPSAARNEGRDRGDGPNPPRLSVSPACRPAECD